MSETIEWSMSTAENEPGAPEGGALFNADVYEREDLRVDRVDGRHVHRISVKFAGTIVLDRTDPEDVALFNMITAGRDVKLQVEGRCGGYTARFAEDADGTLTEVVGERTVKVHTVYR